MRLVVQSMGRKFQERLNPWDLTPLHWGILSCLWKEDGLATQAIARRLQQLGGTVTVGLDAMEKRKLVARKPDAQDARISRIWLRKRGRDLEAEVVPSVEALVEEMFACFSDAELAQLSEQTDRLLNHLSASGMEEKFKSGHRGGIRVVT